MSRRNPILLAAALGIACTFGTLAVGNADNAAADQKVNAALARIAETPAEAPDKLFVLEAAMGNLWEVEFSRLVASKAQDPVVKRVAETIATDHAQSNEKLMPIAQQMQLDLPTELTSEKQGKLAVMAALPIEALENAYVMHMKAGHLKDVASYMDHQTAVRNEALRGYITETLPHLQTHMRQVIRVANQRGMGQLPVGPNAGTATPAGADHATHGEQHGTGNTGNATGGVNADGSGTNVTGPQPNPNAAH